MGVAVGIDLGTTNSCVAVVQGKRAKVVEDRRGERIQPSIISIQADGTVIAGPRAKEQVVIDPENTIYSFKRMLGRDIDTPELQSLIKDFPYDVKKGPDDIPVVRIRNREISLPEISAMMLKHLKDMANESLGVEISDVVITVPANFNDLQRSSTKIAGRIAGFNVLRILNEPTAAALAYGFGGQLTERIAVYDFGGGTFDITIIELMDDIFEVLSTAGDTYLGGDDFDEVIVQEMLGQFLNQHRQNLSEDSVAMQRVRTVAERIKCQLSSLPVVQATLRDIAYDSAGVGIDFSFSMTRERFESVIGPLIDRSLKTCEEALKLAKMDRSGLDNLILVGGTTRVPLVRSKVAEYFGRKPRTEINPDEVVAIGAAIHAYSLTGEALPEEIKKPVQSTPMQDRAGLADMVRTSKIPSRIPRPTAPAPLGQGHSGRQQAQQHTSTQPPMAPTKPVEPVKIQDQKGTVLGLIAPPIPKAPPVQPQPDNSDDLNLPASLDEDVWGDMSEDTALLDSDLVLQEEPSGDPISLAPDEFAETLVAQPDPGAETISLEPNPVDQTIPMEPDSDVMETELPPMDMGDFGDIGFLKGSNVPDFDQPLESAKTVMAMPAAMDQVVGEGKQVIPDDSRKSFSVDVSSAPAKTLLLDVTPRGLGVGTAGGFCDEVIERNAAIPVEQSRMFSTSRDDQTEVAINIYQGESRRVEENTHLGRVELTGIRPAVRGEIKIRVTFEINTDGILGVSARNEETGEAQATKIVLSGGLGDDQINELVKKYSK